LHRKSIKKRPLWTKMRSLLLHDFQYFFQSNRTIVTKFFAFAKELVKPARRYDLQSGCINSESAAMNEVTDDSLRLRFTRRILANSHCKFGPFTQKEQRKKMSLMVNGLDQAGRNLHGIKRMVNTTLWVILIFTPQFNSLIIVFSEFNLFRGRQNDPSTIRHLQKNFTCHSFN
jgi:hypothetical protein